MSKQVTIFSQYSGRQGFFYMENDKSERVWIDPGKSTMDEEIFDKLMKTSEHFKSEVQAERIMKSNPKQEVKDKKHDEKLLKEIEELRGKLKSQDAKDKQIEEMKKQIAQLEANQKAKPGPKPQGN